MLLSNPNQRPPLALEGLIFGDHIVDTLLKILVGFIALIGGFAVGLLLVTLRILLRYILPLYILYMLAAVVFDFPLDAIINIARNLV